MSPRRRRIRPEPEQPLLFSALTNNSTPREPPPAGAGLSDPSRPEAETADRSVVIPSSPVRPSSEPPEAHAQPTLRDTKEHAGHEVRAQRLLTSVRNLVEILRHLDVKRRESPPELGPLGAPVRPRGPAPLERRRRRKQSAAVRGRASRPSRDGALGAAAFGPQPHDDQPVNRPKEN